MGHDVVKNKRANVIIIGNGCKTFVSFVCTAEVPIIGLELKRDYSNHSSAFPLGLSEAKANFLHSGI